ncbi:unnamed protein product [Amoebophrya sp. A25]|nr:unnamed protein product [Amoebophrya sp. A25]|eukprot:GSA25T00012307001.1
MGNFISVAITSLSLSHFLKVSFSVEADAAVELLPVLSTDVTNPDPEEDGVILDEDPKHSGSKPLDTCESNIVAPSQSSAIPVKFKLKDSTSTSEASSSTCNPIRFELKVTYTVASTGDETTTDSPQTKLLPITLQCRKPSDSLLYTFLDHDGTVNRAAAIMPLLSTSPTLVQREAGPGGKLKLPRSSKKTAYPVVLSLHGTGVDVRMQADSYKYKPRANDVRKLLQKLQKEEALGGANEACSSGCTGSGPERTAEVDDRDINKTTSTSFYPLQDLQKAEKAWKIKKDEDVPYLFGIENAWVIAPTRRGAHNWEYTGFLSALAAVKALKRIIEATSSSSSSSISSSLSFPALRLPQLDDEKMIYTGHSMGGHGAMVLATRAPGPMQAVAPLGMWIKKEEYGDSNRFFHLDVQNAHVEPSLKAVLEASMAENSVEPQLGNVAERRPFLPVKFRVGAKDQATPAWFSRRLARSLTGWSKSGPIITERLRCKGVLHFPSLLR